VSACSIKVRGVVQGVGFRPFVLRLAHANTLAGWVFNGDEGVEIFLEGADSGLAAFVEELKTAPPPAAQIAEIEVYNSAPEGLRDFRIRESLRLDRPTTRISPDLPVCDECLREVLDPTNARYFYPYINCTNCGPRYTMIESLPYDRANTTMSEWPLDDFCAGQYHDSLDRRFHAQPVACPACGPAYFLQTSECTVHGNEQSIRRAAELLAAGRVVAMKGLGGYHLACDATNFAALTALRKRKYRKEKPFALMVPSVVAAREIVELSVDAETQLTSAARPIVIARAKVEFGLVAPESAELGVMLPYTPLHYLLFAAGAPRVLVMTSANRSSEPIAYEDIDAIERLSLIADALLIGERRIARRVDDSVVRAGACGPAILRRSRGYAPGAVTSIPTTRPVLALGADLKNTITLVVQGQAFVSQHIGDLSDYQSLRSFQETIDDLANMYDVDWSELLVVHDQHPQYASTVHAESFTRSAQCSVQHHRAHIASVLAERQEWTRRVVGVALDGTGYGDDGTIWGGEFFVGSVQDGFQRAAHLRRAVLPGGDAAAQYPVQAAAGFLAQVDRVPELCASPVFGFPERYHEARLLMQQGVRTFTTTSMGRLFDAAAALLSFTRGVTFEGQAAMWLEQLARTACSRDTYAFPFEGKELDFRPLLEAVVLDRARGRASSETARAFQRGIAGGVAAAIRALCAENQADTAVLSGGVFQNELLLEDLEAQLADSHIALWTNHAVPANDGGISLGQAALAAFGQSRSESSEAGHA
jgi:hydrogenase maturation protein HypF